MSSGTEDRSSRVSWGVVAPTSAVATPRFEHDQRNSSVPSVGLAPRTESYVREVSGGRPNAPRYGERELGGVGAGSGHRSKASQSRVLRVENETSPAGYRDDLGDTSRHLQLTLCLRGTARFQCGSQVQHIRASSVAWSVPSLRFQFVDASSDYDAWVADVDGAIVDRLGIGMHQRQGAGLLRLLTPAASERLAAQFAYLGELDTSSEQFGVGLEYLVLSAWAEQHRATRVDELLDVHPVVEKAAQLLREKPEQGSLRDLAKACGASASWLSRLFREQLGVSLVGYRNQARVDRFFELYREGRGLNLSDAALGAGFGSYAQFHRVFKDTLGFAPGDLKRGVRGALESVRPTNRE